MMNFIKSLSTPVLVHAKRARNEFPIVRVVLCKLFNGVHKPFDIVKALP